MSVPRMFQLSAGVRVNIILKVDQPMGKLTTGHIAEILTRGDHPRGIKVRLTNGQVGRVQSLSSSQSENIQGSSFPDDGTVADKDSRDILVGGRKTRRPKMQNDFRYDGANEHERTKEASLLDYVRAPRNAKSRSRGDGSQAASNEISDTTDSPDEVDDQKRLETEFPKIDSALIAAILTDHVDPTKAREVLQQLG